MGMFRTIRHKMLVLLAVANLAALVGVFVPDLAPQVVRWATAGVLGVNLLFFGWVSRWV